MALRLPKTHDACTAEVAFAPDEVDAGTAFTLTISVACPDGCDLRGLTISVRNEDDDTELLTAKLGEADEDGRHSTGDLTLTAPPAAGALRLRLALDGTPKKRIVHALRPALVTVPIKAHSTRINAWELPSAVNAGESFSFLVGVKCSAGCTLAGHDIQLMAADDAIGAGELGEEVWPGTEALHYARVTATAPSEPGMHEWEIVSPATEAGLPHETGRAKIALNVVPAPDFEITIQALDREQQTPIQGARIVMHPYRAVCDGDGVARLKVARGSYRMLVSGPKHVSVRQDIIVDDNVVTKAVLDKEPPPFNPDELYY